MDPKVNNKVNSSKSFMRLELMTIERVNLRSSYFLRTSSNPYIDKINCQVNSLISLIGLESMTIERANPKLSQFQHI